MITTKRPVNQGVRDIIGSRVRRRRTELGLTYREVAERTGLSMGFIAHVEKGDKGVTVDSLLAIAEALGVHVMWFFRDVK